MIKLRAGLVIAVDLMLAAVYLILSHYNGSGIDERINTLAFVPFPLVGAILLLRHPRNPVGYLVSVLGLSVLGASTLYEYGALALREWASSPPFTGEAVWVSMVLWTIVLPCLVLILLLFPNGRLPGPGWKLLVVITILTTIPALLTALLVAWPMRNKMVWMDAGRIPYTPELIQMNNIYDMWNLATIFLIIAALVSFFVRFFRARGIERQQLKWFVLGLSSIPIGMILERLLVLFDTPAMEWVAFVINNLSIIAFPTVMLIAITRYRLYDIDFLIRRTLLYSALTLTLSMIYFGTVLIFQSLFTREIGEQPTFVIVLSTLVIAALFQPLRRRFQEFIDRRFHRSRYNAEQTLERFSMFVQNEVDLDEIRQTIIRIVDENIQPDGTDLWLVKSASRDA